MFERYTESARRALFFARYEVTELGGLAIEPEHLLLGLLRAITPVVDQVFREAKISIAEVRGEVERRLVERERVATSIEVPFSEAAKRALRFTEEEANRMNLRWIGTEHLLLALLRDERGVISALLTAHGLRLGDARDRIAALITSASETASPLDPDDLLALVVRIQQRFEEFAHDAINRGAPAEEAQIIMEEFESLKRLLEADEDQ